MSIIENLKSYFRKKQNQEETTSAPEGVCPNCWGKQEWDGHYYEFMKGEKGNPSEETYNSFIQNVVRKLGKIEIDKDTYTCTNCHIHYDE